MDHVVYHTKCFHRISKEGVKEILTIPSFNLQGTKSIEGLWSIVSQLFKEGER